MKVAVASVVILSLLVAVGLVAYALRPRPEVAIEHVRVALILSPEEGLVIHEEMAREVLGAFRKWCLEEHGRLVKTHLILEDFEALRRELARGRLNFDIWWGGTLDLLMEGEEFLLAFNSSLKEELLDMIPNGTYHGCPVMDLTNPTPKWYAWCFYSPCLVYNPSALAQAPEDWDELAELAVRLENQVLVPYPVKDPYSADIAMTIYAYEAWRLGNESLGWTRAWNISVLIWASSEELITSPWEAILEVAIGRKVAVLCPDIIAYHMLLEAGYGHLALKHLNGTLLSPCPVAVVRRPKEAWAPKAFVDFLLSKEGQAIVAKYVMPIRPDVEPREPIPSPFSDAFPITEVVNETFLDMGKGFMRDYHISWLADPHEDLRRAWWWVRKANGTRMANQNATKYFRWAFGNLTLASTYVTREDFDRIYNQTGNWTDKADVINEWGREALEAYERAMDCARTSIEYARGTASGTSSMATRGPGHTGPLSREPCKSNENSPSLWEYLMAVSGRPRGLGKAR